MGSYQQSLLRLHRELLFTMAYTAPNSRRNNRPSSSLYDLASYHTNNMQTRSAIQPACPTGWFTFGIYIYARTSTYITLVRRLHQFAYSTPIRSSWQIFLKLGCTYICERLSDIQIKTAQFLFLHTNQLDMPAKEAKVLRKTAIWWAFRNYMLSSRGITFIAYTYKTTQVYWLQPRAE